jgi:DNA-binding transcriptional LysR family regulator
VAVIVTTFKRYRHLLVLVEHGSFRRAAAALRISQPALTKSVQALEAELGVQLFDRQPRQLRLNEFGQRVLAHAHILLAAEQDLHHDLGNLAGLSAGWVDVVLGPYPSVISGYAAAARLRRAHPQLQVRLRVENWRVVTRAVAERRADFGIAELSDAAGNADLLTEVVGQHQAHFFCRPEHPILRRRRVELGDLFQYPWACTRMPPRIVQLFPQDLGRAGSLDDVTGDMVPAVELDVPMQLAAFTQGSDTLVFGAFALLERELAAGQVAVVPSAPLVGQYGFIWLKHRSLSPASQAFMQAIREEERDFVERELELAARYAGDVMRPRSARR